MKTIPTYALVDLDDEFVWETSMFEEELLVAAQHLKAESDEMQSPLRLAIYKLESVLEF